MRHAVEIKWSTGVVKTHFNTFRPQPTLNLEHDLMTVPVGVTDDIAKGLSRGENNRVGFRLAEIGDLADGLHKSTGHGQHAQIAWDGERQGRQIGHYRFLRRQLL